MVGCRRTHNSQHPQSQFLGAGGLEDPLTSSLSTILERILWMKRVPNETIEKPWLGPKSVTLSLLPTYSPSSRKWFLADYLVLSPQK